MVVIAIIAVLIGLLIPSLAKAKLAARQTREMSGGRQVLTAFTLYANDNRGLILPGYPTRTMVNGPMPVIGDRGQRLLDEEAQRFPWRLAPAFNYDFRGLYDDDKVLASLRDGEATYSAFGVGYEYVVSLFPSLGMNIAFVGGSDRHSGFDPVFNRVFGKVYVERIDDARRPSQLLAFASARADPQPQVPFLSRPQGFFRLEPPRFAAHQSRAWAASYEENTPNPGLNSGFVALRYGGKAVTAHLDSHVGTAGWADLNDMRMWADQATGPDWALTPR